MHFYNYIHKSLHTTTFVFVSQCPNFSAIHQRQSHQFLVHFFLNLLSHFLRWLYVIFHFFQFNQSSIIVWCVSLSLVFPCILVISFTTYLKGLKRVVLSVSLVYLPVVYVHLSTFVFTPLYSSISHSYKSSVFYPMLVRNSFDYNFYCSQT